ncbi:hypothetical protein HOLleu_15939 [Holothuria leucospilota]|uniref:Uncharacterized protein n=1 Tax=Holothuria leucospilota TaxID=206669 RepID=A0A9Q1C511_HOLLE|nr:hypothetical protein HOLleu_15939 [Holothuria leucospilota]
MFENKIKSNFTFFHQSCTSRWLLLSLASAISGHLGCIQISLFWYAPHQPMVALRLDSKWEPHKNLQSPEPPPPPQQKNPSYATASNERHYRVQVFDFSLIMINRSEVMF